MTPSRIEFDLGVNAHGQPVRLVRGASSSHKTVWTIFRDEADQRDDRSEVGGLTDAQLIAMAKAVETSKTIR